MFPCWSLFLLVADVKLSNSKLDLGENVDAAAIGFGLKWDRLFPSECHYQLFHSLNYKDDCITEMRLRGLCGISDRWCSRRIIVAGIRWQVRHSLAIRSRNGGIRTQAPNGIANIYRRNIVDSDGTSSWIVSECPTFLSPPAGSFQAL